MQYVGSKARIAKDVIAITTARRGPGQVYVEPFVGGGNVINKVPQGAGRIANDKNFAMVALLHALGNLGWTPPETMTEAEWERIMRKEPTLQNLAVLEQAEFAFAAIGPTFGAKWCDSWAKDYPGEEGKRYRQARNSAIKDAAGLKGIDFHSGNYDEFPIPPESIVYCDPPYANTLEYLGSKTQIKVGAALSANNWNAARFWKWCDKLADEGHQVFVSEYTGPAATVFRGVPTSEQSCELAAARAALKALDPRDTSIPTSDFEAARLRITAIEDDIRKAGEAQAARWAPVWEKKIVSKLSDDRGEHGKKAIEYLFTRGG